jgi:hypothetical protein
LIVITFKRGHSMNAFRTLLCIVLFTLTAIVASAQQTIYVRQDGDDGNGGLAANDARATLVGALAIAQANDVIDIGPGAFDGANIPLSLNIRGANAGAAFAQWGATTTFNTPLTLDAANINIVIEGVEFTGGIVPVNGASQGSGVTFSGCRFSEAGTISTTGMNWTELSIVGCQFDGDLPQALAGRAQAVVVDGTAEFLINETTITDFTGTAVEIKGTTGNAVIRYSEFENCNTGGNTAQAAITVTSNTVTGAISVVNSLFTNCSNGIATTGSSAGKDISFTGNKFQITTPQFFAIKNGGTGVILATCNAYGNNMTALEVRDLLSGALEAGPFNDAGVDIGGNNIGFDGGYGCDAQALVRLFGNYQNPVRGFFRIQDALSVAGNDNTIETDVASFTENLTISKSVTIRSTDEAPYSSHGSNWTTVNGTVTISIAAANVTLSGLKITSPTATQLITSNATGNTVIQNCWLAVDPTSVVANVPANGAVHVTKYGAFRLVDSKITRPVSVNTEAQQYIKAVTFAAGNASRDVVIQENRLEGTIQLTGLSQLSSVNISDNYIVDAGQDGVAFTGNTVRTLSLANNSITDSRNNGISIRDRVTVGDASATIQNNLITGSGQAGFTYAAINIAAMTYGTQTFSNNHIGSSFGSNKAFINSRTHNYTPNVSCNWWGVVSDDDINAAKTGNANFVKWLVGGGNNNTNTPGFMPTAACSGEPITLTLVPTNILCFGYLTGELATTASTSTAGTFTYAWTGPNGFTSNGEDLSGLAPGTYNVTVTSSLGSTKKGSATITQPSSFPSFTFSKKNYNSSDMSCNNANDAEIVFTATGGTTRPNAPYTYSINDGGSYTSNNVFSGLAVGTYNLRLKDGNNCETAAQMVVVTTPPALTASAAVTSDFNGAQLSCNGASNGVITVTSAGGTGALSYSKDGTTYQSSNVFTGLTAGSYTFTTKDVNGCMKTSTATISNPPTLTSSSAVTSNYAGSQLSCSSASDGQISVTSTGGTGSLTYSKDGTNYQSSNVFAGLGAGLYTFTTKDVNGCTTTSSATITAPASITSSAAVTSNYNGSQISCFGSSDGTITVTSTGGTGSLTYSKNGVNFQTSNVFSGLAAGAYTFTTKDVNGCTTTASATITTPALLTSSSAVSSDYNGAHIRCATSSDGEITVSALGGTGSYQYAMNGGSYQASNKFTNLAAGSYTFTSKDVNGCTSTSTATIVAPATLTSSAAVTSNFAGSQVSCNGASDGQITITVTGGTGAREYSRNGGASWQASNIFDGLIAGAYTITTRDANGCTSTSSTSITQPTAVSVSASVTSNYGGSQVSCNGASDGTITASASGGTGTKEFSKDGSNYQVSNVFNGLAAGAYTIYAKDVNGCVATTSVTITQPPAIVISSAATRLYLGVPGQESWETAVGYPSIKGGYNPGTTYGVYDQVNYLGTEYVMVVFIGAAGYAPTAYPQNWKTLASLTQISCNGANNGGIKVAASGGTGGLQYSLDGTNWTGTSTFENLSPGTYTVYVKDGNNCQKTVSNIVITEPALLEVATATKKTYALGSELSCNTSTDGQITVTAAGGTGSRLYSKDNGANWQTSNVFGGLGAGTYQIKVKDDNKCVSSAYPVTITAPAALASSAAVTSNFAGSQLSCNGASDGQITVTSSGGTGTLTYSKDGTTFQASNIFTGLAAGSFTFTTKDANGCLKTATASISAPPAITTSSSVTSNYNGSQLSCNGASDGAITVTASGGTGTLTYSKDGTTFQSSNVFTGLAAGAYTLTTKDVNGCTKTSTSTITAPSSITTSAAVTSNYNGSQLSCNGSTNGVITVSSSGGTGALTYSKDGTNYQSSNVFSGLAAGSYTLTTKDANGCTKTATTTITAPPALTASAAVSKTYNGSQLSCNAAADGQITVTSTGGTGALSYSKDGTNFQTSSTFTGLAAGSYTFTTKDVNACTITSTATITAPPVINSSAAVTSNYNGAQIKCNGSTDGIITVTSSGGTSTLTYSIDGTNYQASNVFTGLGAGSYTFTTKDANGCTKTATATIIAPIQLSLSAAVTSNYNGAQLSCNGTSDGAITVTPTGGTGLREYSIDGTNYQTSNVFAGLGAGAYTITVKDQNSCSATASATITAPSTVAVSSVSKKSYNGADLSCNGASDGEITITSNGGGVGPYTYAIAFGFGGRPFQSSNVFSGLAAGTYNAYVKDANGCTSQRFGVTITAPTAMSATASVTSNYNGAQLNCPNSTDGAVTVTSSGGTGAYSYKWEKNTGTWTQIGTTQSLSGLGGGTYRVTVSDANICSVTQEVEIIAPPATIIVSTTSKTYIGGANISCAGASDGEITVTATGGTGTLEYSKDNGVTYQSSNVFTGLAAGTYTMVVKDANVCPSAPADVVLTAPSAVVINSYAANSKVNVGNPVTFTASVSGGVHKPSGSKYTYEWTTPAGGAVPSLTTETGSGTITSTFTITAASVADNGTYTLTVKDANNCTVVSAGKQVIVYPSTLVVSLTGNDATGDGRDANPLRTIQKANDVAIAGNTIDVKAGQFDESPVLSKALTVIGTNTSTLGSGRYFIYGTTSAIDFQGWPTSVWDNVGVNGNGSIATALDKVNGGSNSALWILGSHTVTAGFTINKQLAIRGATDNATVPDYTGCDIAPTSVITLTGTDVTLFTMSGASTKTMRDLELRIPNTGFFVAVQNGSTGDITSAENMVYKWASNAATPNTYRRLFGMVNGNFSGGTEKFDVAKFVNDANESTTGFGSGRFIYGNNGPLPWNNLVVGWKSEDGESATNQARIQKLHDAKTDLRLQSGLLFTPRPWLNTTDALFNSKYFLSFDGGQYLDGNTNTSISSGAQKSLFLVFAPVKTTADQVIYKHGDNRRGMSIAQLADGKISLNIYNDIDDTPGALTHETWIYPAPTDNTVLIAQIYFNGDSDPATGHRIGASLDKSTGRIDEINHGNSPTGWLTDADFSPTELQTPAAIDGSSVVSMGCRGGAYYYGGWVAPNVVNNSSTASTGRGHYYKGKIAELVMINSADQAKRDAVYCYLRNKYFANDQTVENTLNKDGDVIAGEAPTLEPEIAAYPNPVDAELQIEVAVPIAGRIVIAVKDALGRTVQTVFEGDVQANTVVPVQANVGNLPSGAYFIHASGNGDLNVATPLMIRR